jgi:hypothetical protein
MLVPLICQEFFLSHLICQDVLYTLQYVLFHRLSSHGLFTLYLHLCQDMSSPPLKSVCQDLILRSICQNMLFFLPKSVFSFIYLSAFDLLFPLSVKICSLSISVMTFS